MLTGDKLIDITISYIMGRGVNTDESLIKRMALWDMINTASAFVKKSIIEKGGVLGDNNKLVTYSAYEDISDSQFRYFYLPKSLGSTYEYIGNDKCRFREYFTISAYNSTVKCQIPSITGYFKQGDMVKVDNTFVEEIKVVFIPIDPMKVPTYNFLYDPYPLDEELIPAMLQMLYKVYFEVEEQRPSDTKSDSQPTPKSIVQ
jgi:hypothetical protein